MGSLTFSELLTIAVIVLIVFGPNRLPELARRAGAMLTRVRAATREIRDELQEEYRETIAPLEDMKEDLRAARADLAAAREELTAAASEVSRDLDKTADPDSDFDDKPQSGPGPASLTGPAVPGGQLEPLEAVRDELKAAREALEPDSGQPAAGRSAPADPEPASEAPDPAARLVPESEEPPGQDEGAGDDLETGNAP